MRKSARYVILLCIIFVLGFTITFIRSVSKQRKGVGLPTTNGVPLIESLKIERSTVIVRGRNLYAVRIHIPLGEEVIEPATKQSDQGGGGEQVWIYELPNNFSTRGISAEGFDYKGNSVGSAKLTRE